MNENNSTINFGDSCHVKEETGNYNSIVLDCIKDEINPYQNDSNESYHNEYGNVIDKSNNTTYESFGKDTILEIKSEIEYNNTSMQNSMFVTKDIDIIKNEILTNDDNDETYSTENVTLNTNTSDNITTDTLNVYGKSYYNNDSIKIEVDSPECSNIFAENVFQIKTEIEPNNLNNFDTLTNVLSSDSEDVKKSNIIQLYGNVIDKSNNITTDTLNVYGKSYYNNDSIKIEVDSPECSNIFAENVFQIKTEIEPNNLNNFDTLTNVLSSDSEDVKKSNIIQLYGNVIDKSNNITTDTLNVYGKSYYNNDSIKIEVDSPECSNIFAENVFQIKTEIEPNNLNNFDTLTNVFSSDSEDVKKSNIIQLYGNVIDKSNNITTDTLNVCGKIKKETDYKHTSINNSISVIEDGDSVKNENDNVPSSKSFLLSSVNNENTTFQINDNNSSSSYNNDVINEIERMSPECSYTFAENVSEIDSDNSNNFETLTNVSSSKREDVNNSHIIQLEFNTNAVTSTHGIIHYCPICQELFAYKGALQKHMVIHTGEKPYKCIICKESFAFKDSLKEHMFYHTNERPHKCKICKKSFKFQNILNAHMLFHNGKTPHVCKICKKGFIRKSTLERHILSHTYERSHVCEICQVTFKQERYLKKHQLKHK